MSSQIDIQNLSCKCFDIYAFCESEITDKHSRRATLYSEERKIQYNDANKFKSL